MKNYESGAFQKGKKAKYWNLESSANYVHLHNITFSNQITENADNQDIICKSEDECQIYDIFFE